jgi:two-component system, OmpR family, response regulator
VTTQHTPEARLLVVEDDANIVELLGASLRYAGFEVVTVQDRHRALSHALELRPDLVVLDVTLPGIDGFEVARRLNSDGRRRPQLFLTAREATTEKIAGPTIGGDDYVTKPFSLDKVIARIRAVLRRSGFAPDTAPARRSSSADIEMDEETHEVWKNGIQIALSPTEFNLLRYFVENAGRVLSKARSSTTSGVTTSAVTPTSSSRTCRTCGGRSTPPSLGCCTRCPASGTCSGGPAVSVRRLYARTAVMTIEQVPAFRCSARTPPRSSTSYPLTVCPMWMVTVDTCESRSYQRRRARPGQAARRGGPAHPDSRRRRWRPHRGRPDRAQLRCGAEPPGGSERYRVRVPRPRAHRERRALVLLQHLCGNLDKWDPALVDALAEHSRVGLPPSPAGVERLLPTATSG